MRLNVVVLHEDAGRRIPWPARACLVYIRRGRVPGTHIRKGLIGRQEDTSFGGRVDFLAVGSDGVIVLIELKRDRTPREVVAQAIDYAYWVCGLDPDDIAAIYGRFAPGRSLAADFEERFGQELGEDALNQSHQIVVVGATLDDSTERIIAYLTERGIPINALLFQVFAEGAEQLISRAWLIDPVRAQVSSAASPGDPSEPWNGEFYGSFGHGRSRSREDAVEYGFICTGGGSWYSRTLQVLAGSLQRRGKPRGWPTRG